MLPISQCCEPRLWQSLETTLLFQSPFHPGMRGAIMLSNVGTVSNTHTRTLIFSRLRSLTWTRKSIATEQVLPTRMRLDLLFISIHSCIKLRMDYLLKLALPSLRPMRNRQICCEIKLALPSLCPSYAQQANFLRNCFAEKLGPDYE
jgi:hypothetical protein